MAAVENDDINVLLDHLIDGEGACGRLSEEAH